MAPLTAITPNGVAEVDTHRATYRSDTGGMLGVVGADYQPHQPAELLELARLTLDAGADDGHVEVLGSLRGGRTVFATIALPGDVTIGGDVHVPRLVWVTSMDGTHRHPRRRHVRAGGVHEHDPGQLPPGPHQLGRPPHLQPRRPHRRRPPRPAAGVEGRQTRSAPRSKPSPPRRSPTARSARSSRAMWPDDPAATARTRDSASRRRAAIRRMYQSDPRVAGWHGTAYGLVQAVSTWELWDAPRRGQRGEQVLAGLFAGTKTKADTVAERLAALA